MFKILLGKALWRWLTTVTDEAPGPESAESAGAVRQEEPGAAPRSEPASPSAPPAETVYPRVERRAMGSLFEIYLAGTDRAGLVAAGEEALEEIERLDRQLSHYREDSDVTRLNLNAREQWVRLEPRLYRLLKRCVELGAATEGAFDITTGPLIKAWGFFRGEGRVPPEDEIADLLQNTGFYRILFDDDDHLVYFAAPKLEVNLGAIGKGYAIDEAADVLKTYGVRSAVLHGGQSTIYALGAPPEAPASSEGPDPPDDPPAGWKFEIKDPRDSATVLETVWLRDEAISTSGSYEQFFEAGGTRYSHILDPCTGRPVQGMLSVSVVAPSAAETDALSTAFFVLGPEGAQEYCNAHPNVRAVLIEEAPGDEGGIRVTRIGLQ